MKALIALMALVLSILLVLLGFSIFTKYRSAFEADQACHFTQSQEYPGLVGYGCDHDLETRQWILFYEGNSNQKANVLKRFYY